MQRLDWFDLRNMLQVARAVDAGGARCAPKAAARISARTFPECCRTGASTRSIRLARQGLDIAQAPASPIEVAAQ